MPIIPVVPTPHLLVHQDGRVTTPWLQFFMALLSLANGGTPGSGPAPSDGAYILGTANALLPNGRVVTDSPSIDFDLGTPGQLKAHVIVDAAGALDGGTLADLKVRVDGVTITINGSNQLESLSAGGSWIPLSAGVEPLTFISDGAGNPVLVAYP